MKKIYMIMAAMTLLTLSLNAQQTAKVNTGSQVELKSVNTKHSTALKNSNGMSFNNMLRGSIKVMEGILPECSPVNYPKGGSRAPLKINADETTLGPFTGDNFDNGLGFGAAYSQPQYILIATDLTRSEFADYIGEEIVGFRFALAGDATSRVRVSEVIAWPIDFTSGNFDQDHLYSWPLTDFVEPEVTYIDQYVKVTSTADLTSGAEYLIVCENNNVAFDGSRTSLDVAGNTISVTPSNGIIASTATTDAATFTITANGNSYSIRSKSGYYIGRTTNSNGMNTNQNTAYTNNITFTNGNATIAGQYRYLRYLATQGNLRFRYYATNSGAQNIQLYKKVTVPGPTPDYVDLQAGQWHEFYLDEPVVFQTSSNATDLFLGYNYLQYPTGTTGQNLYPMAVNSQSQGHDHYAYMTTETTSATGDITITFQNCFQTSVYYIIVTDNETGDYLTYWTSDGATYSASGNTAYELPTGWSLDGATYMYQETNSGYNFGYLSVNGSASIVISSSAFGNKSDVSVTIAAVGWDTGYTVSVNGDAKTIEAGTLADYEWPSVQFQGGTPSTSTGWSAQGFSSMYGDLAVQLIFKSQMQKTATPVITTSMTDDAVTITATGDGIVTLTVGGQTVQGEGSVSITLGRGADDYTVTATATAKEEDKLESDPATQSVLIPAAELEPTATPDISSQVYDMNVGVTGTGDGTVHMYIDGVEVTNPYYLERRDTEYTVEVTVTAQEDGKAMSSKTETVVVPPIGSIDLTGWTELGTFGTNDVINWGEHMMFVDRFSVSTAFNDHPEEYLYQMSEDKTNGQNTSTLPVPVLHTGSVMHGVYSIDQIESDSLRLLKMGVLNTEVELTLKNETDIYYYTLDRSLNHEEDESYIELSKLQRNTQNMYREMGAYFPQEPTLDPGIVYRNDSITSFFEGTYGSSFMDYVPIVWTMGNATGNKRANYDVDGKHNSYGAPVWKNGVGQALITSAGAERQIGKYGSTNWVDENGDSCSLYMLTIDALGWLPSNTNIDYKPYMFRVFVASESGQLRGYSQILNPGIDPDNTGDPGSHLENNTEVDRHLWCVWDEHTEDTEFFKAKSNTWAENIMFGALNDISDLQVFVRFYYIVDNGSMPIHSNGFYANRASGPGGAGAESPGFSPDPSTAITELWMNGDSYHGEVVSTTYVNAQGMQSSKPFDGLNIVLTRYSDGTTVTTKVIK